MNKIEEKHLSRPAYIYIRQSTQDQVVHHLESKRRQYALEGKARELGWAEVIVVDEDLGKTASGCAYRAGFEHILAKVCEGMVGGVFAIEASRLARNGREWHTLLELCGFMETLIIDHDGIYDPRHPNDRLLLGMKGTISEMELTILRQRSQEALRLKAARGELHTSVAIGYLRSMEDRLEKDPDRRIQSAIELVFSKFRDLGSARQVLLWFRQEKVLLPVVRHQRGERTVQWRLPIYNTILRTLTNPVYAGAYAFGRTQTSISFQHGTKSKKRGIRRPQADWPVLIFDHHESYVGWEEYQRNLRLIAENANMKGAMVRGSVKRGPSLLAGLLRCGHCGRKLHVCYSQSHPRYGCRGALINHGESACISLGAFRLEKHISEAVLSLLSPLGIQAAAEAMRRMAERQSQALCHKELALQQARYEAERAHKQYNLADPENRLVAAELEHRWNEALEVVQALEGELAQQQSQQTNYGPEEQRQLVALGEELQRVWYHPQADSALKKRIVRAVVKEIVLTMSSDMVTAMVHWEGGDHSEIKFPRTRSGEHRWTTNVETERIIRELTRLTTDKAIVSLLNRLGKKTAKGNSWTAGRLAAFRSDRGIPMFREGELEERGEMTAEQVAATLGLSSRGVYKLIRDGKLPARQVCFGAPWIIKRSDLDRAGFRIDEGGKTVRRTSPCTPDQQELSLDETTT